MLDSEVSKSIEGQIVRFSLASINIDRKLTKDELRALGVMYTLHSIYYKPEKDSTLDTISVL
jgi:hypothetical protein